MASKIAEAFVTLRPSLDGFESEARRGFSRINLTQKVKVQAEVDTSQVQKAAGGLSGAFAGAKGVAGGILAVEGLKEFIHFSSDAVKAAAEDEASIIRLQTAVENTGATWKSYASQLDAVVTKGLDLGFTDDESRQALALLTAQTDNAGEAMKRFALAQDLSRGTGIDLVTASRLLGKVTEENVNVLARYGIRVKEGSTETELFAAVYAKFHGQAQAFADSTAGGMARVNVQLSETKEEFGRRIIPLYTDGLKAVNFGLGAVNKSLDGWGQAQDVVTSAVGFFGDKLGITDGKVVDYQKRLRELGEKEAPDVARATGIINRSFEAQTGFIEGLHTKLGDLQGQQIKTNGATIGAADSMDAANKKVVAFNENLDKQIAAIKGNGLQQDIARQKLELQRQSLDDVSQRLTNVSRGQDLVNTANKTYTLEGPKATEQIDRKVRALNDERTALGLSTGGTDRDKASRDAHSATIDKELFSLSQEKARIEEGDASRQRSATNQKIIQDAINEQKANATAITLHNIGIEEQGLQRQERAIRNVETTRGIQAQMLDITTRKTIPYTQAQIDAARAAEEVAVKQAGWNGAMLTESRLLQDVLTHLTPVVKSSQDWLTIAQQMDDAAGAFNKELSNTGSALDKWKNLPTPELLALKAAQSDVNLRIAEHNLALDKQGKGADATSRKLDAEAKVIADQIAVLEANRQKTIDVTKAQLGQQQQLDGVTRGEWLWVASLKASSDRLPREIALQEQLLEIERNRALQAQNPDVPLFGPAPPSRDIGGPVSAGQAYMIGAGVKEIFVPNKDGNIIPMQEAARAIGGAAAGTGGGGRMAAMGAPNITMNVRTLQAGRGGAKGSTARARTALGTIGWGVTAELNRRGVYTAVGW